MYLVQRKAYLLVRRHALIGEMFAVSGFEPAFWPPSGSDFCLYGSQSRLQVAESIEKVHLGEPIPWIRESILMYPGPSHPAPTLCSGQELESRVGYTEVALTSLQCCRFGVLLHGFLEFLETLFQR